MNHLSKEELLGLLKFLDDSDIKVGSELYFIREKLFGSMKGRDYGFENEY